MAMRLKFFGELFKKSKRNIGISEGFLQIPDHSQQETSGVEESDHEV